MSSCVARPPQPPDPGRITGRGPEPVAYKLSYVYVTSVATASAPTAPATYGDLLPAVRDADPAGGTFAGVFVGVAPGDEVRVLGWDVKANKKV